MAQSKVELLRFKPSDSFNVFSSSPFIPELLVLTCTVPDSPPRTSSICTLPHTLPDVYSFMIYRQYLCDDKDHSVCAFAKFQSKQSSIKWIQQDATVFWLVSSDSEEIEPGNEV